MLAVILFAACAEEIALRHEKTLPHDFGRAALASAVAELARSPDDPAAYRRFALQVASIRPLFNQRMADEAELRLTTLALAPMTSHGDGADHGAAKLATAVWPTALMIEPGADESAMDYLARVCSDTHAEHCLHVVPQYWSGVLGNIAWMSFAERTSDAVQHCSPCQYDDTYRNIATSFRERADQSTAAAERAQELGHPRHWPSAHGHEPLWSHPPTLSIRPDGTTTWRGVRHSAGEWRRAMREESKRDTFGLEVVPETPLVSIVALFADAKRAGYREAAIMLREIEYPYHPRELRWPLAQSPIAGTILRLHDPLQMWIESLHAER